MQLNGVFLIKKKSLAGKKAEEKAMEYQPDNYIKQIIRTIEE